MVLYISTMLFKTVDGKYVEILRSHYLTDTAYYTAIMKVKGKAAKDAITISEVSRIQSVIKMSK